MFQPLYNSDGGSTIVNQQVSITNPSGFPAGTYTSNNYFAGSYNTSTGWGIGMSEVVNADGDFSRALVTLSNAANANGLDPDFYVYWELPMQFTVTKFQFRNSTGTGNVRYPNKLELYGRNGANSYSLMGSITLSSAQAVWFSNTLTGATPYTDFYVKFHWNGVATGSEHGTIQIDGEY